jgi:N utilization substance protein A
MEIIVPDDQLSLAIGRKGQNVRLASQLAGWRLDIHSESRIQEIRDRAWESLKKVDGVNEFLIQTLYNHGIRSAQQLIDADRSFFVQFPGVEEENIDKILQSAAEIAKLERHEEEESRMEAERSSRANDGAKALNELNALDDEGRMRQVRGVGDTTYSALTEAGFSTVEAVADAEVEDLAGHASISEQKAKQLKYGAKQRLKKEEDIRAAAEDLGIEMVDGVAKSPTQIEDEKRAAEEAAAAAAAAAEAAAAAPKEEPETDQARAEA